MQMRSYSLVNSEIVASDEAKISAADRGFRFGDGVFETIRIHKLTPYQWQAHMDRLQHGLNALRININPHSLKPLARLIIQKNQLDYGFLRISISRGVGSSGYRPTGCTPTIIMEVMPPAPLDTSVCKLHVSQFKRPALDTMPANAKLSYGITNTLACLEASDHACEDAIILSPCGHVAETSCGNIFWSESGNLYTPPLASCCVNGTIRTALFRLCNGGIAERMISPKALARADEIFITNVRSLIRKASLLGISSPQHSTHADRLLELLRADIDHHVATHLSYWQQ